MRVSSEVFANKLKYYINRLGISQAEFARRIRVTPAAVSAWCVGKAMPGNAAMFDTIADALGVTVADLVDENRQEDKRHLLAYANLLRQREDLQTAIELLRRVPAEDLPKVIEMIRVFAKED